MPPELVIRANGVGGKLTHAIYHYDPIVGTDRHDAKFRNASIKARYVLTDEQATLPLDELARMAAAGKLPRWEPKKDTRSANEKAVAEAASKQKDKT